ncbi:choice-of-anchor D domain-containing protein [Flavobacterium sp.]|uniref:choice-of-anchor D domain-containing protein n=1 Tax=Flavobacterium sp. TaxID=239 RepID=UPI0039E33232
MQTSVGTNPSTAYTGAGFSPNPTVAGRLNSNAWEVKGWSFGDLLFGGTQTVDDFGRGAVAVGVVTPGMYAFTDFPATAANPALMIQPGVGDFAPGTVALKIRNDGTANLTQLSVDYNLFVRNDENTSSSFNFSHSADNIVYVQESVLDYISPDVLDAFQWVSVGTAPSRTCIISGLNIPPGGVYYIRWSSALVTGTGDSDEFGLDDIHITGTYGSPAPEINVTCYGNTLLSGDTTPTVGEGTDFAPSYAPMSTLLTTLQITYYIQNLGGLPLNITNVTITGANASDFSITGAMPTGSIPAASATISNKQFVVIFDPSASGLRTARVNIFNDDSNENPYWFDIQGYGVVPIPDIRINGGPTGGLSIVTNGSMIPNINNNTLYSNQAVGGAGETKGFEIRNDCPQNAPLILTGPSPYVTIAGNHPTDFTLVTIPTGNSINPGFKRQFSIKFAPTATGIRNAIVSVASDDPDENPYTFLVQGTGVAPEMDVTGNLQPIVSGSTTTSFVNHTFFDYLNINTGTLDRTFTITNSGTVTLTIGTLTLTGANATDFSIITAPPATLAAGASTTFVIRFDPSAVGLRVATVNIVNNDPNENPYTFAISGFGLDYIPCAFGAIETIATQDFEAVPATPTWTYSTTGTSTLAGGTAFGLSGDGGGSTRYLGARSLQVINGTANITMANINTTQYNDIELNLRLASLAVTTGEGADAADRVMVSVSSNGGATWSNEIEVVGNTDAKWSFTSGTGIATAAFDNNNVLTTFNPGSGGYLTTNGYSTLSISGLPKVTGLVIRVTVTNNSANEIWAIDNVTLFGRKELSSTWNGSGWSAGVPTNTIKAIIDGNYSTSANGNISSCKCEIKTGRTVTINSNNYFDIQSDVDNAGTLIIENGGSLVQRNDLATNIGAIRVKRTTTAMRSFDYTYWSSPVIGQTLFNLSPLTLADKYFSFNPTTGLWAVIPNGTDVMLPGKGYIIRAPQGFTTTPQPYTGAEFVGVPNNGFIQTPIVIGASNMNLIGNPYPSAISADAFLSNSANVGTVEGTIYLWTHNTVITSGVYNSNDYAVYNFSGSVATRAALTPGVNPFVPTGNIASGQGFFIKGLANGQATFNNSMRLTGNNLSFFRTAQPSSTATPSSMVGIEKNRVWLNLSNSEDAFKQTLVGYIEGATNGIDRGFDGEIFNGNTYVNLYSINEGKNMAIQGRALPFDPEDKVILGYSTTMGGLFQISIDNVDGLLMEQDIYLEDKLLGIIHNLKAAPYSFETATGTVNDRFELRYNNSTLGTNPFDSVGNDIILTTNRKQIDILSQEEAMKSVTVYDILGRNVHDNDKVNAKTYSIPNAVSNQQALIVKIVLENGKVVTRKVVL